MREHWTAPGHLGFLDVQALGVRVKFKVNEHSSLRSYLPSQRKGMSCGSHWTPVAETKNPATFNALSLGYHED